MHPEEWNPYFTRREPKQQKDFEEGYWGVVTDPDGVTRDLLAERERRVADVKEEIAFVNRLPPARMLDVGCGLGYLLSGVDQRWEKHGVEISEFAARHAAQHAKVHVGDLRSAAYPDKHFDLVVLYHVIEHMKSPVDEIREIRRILKPGGHLVLGTPDFDSACARRYGERYRMLHDQTHISLFSHESLRRFLWDHGFIVGAVEFPYFDTPHFAQENFERLKSSEGVSPPFYGNIMTFYCTKPVRTEAVDVLAMAGRISHRIAVEQELELDHLGHLLVTTSQAGGQVWVSGDAAFEHAARLAAAGYQALAWADANKLPQQIKPTDLLLVVATEVQPDRLLALAQQRGIACALLCSELSQRERPLSAEDRCDASATPNSEQILTIHVPSAEPMHIEFVHQFVMGAVCTASTEQVTIDESAA